MTDGFNRKGRKAHKRSSTVSAAVYDVGKRVSVSFALKKLALLATWRPRRDLQAFDSVSLFVPFVSFCEIDGLKLQSTGE